MQQHDTEFEDIVIRPRSEEPLDEGTYPATLVGYQRVQGRFGEQVRLDFEVCAPDGRTRRLPLYCALLSDPSPKSKLYQCIVALQGGQPLNDGDAYRLRALVGAKCRVLVEHKQLPDGRGTVEKLSKVYPARAARPAPAATEEGDPFA